MVLLSTSAEDTAESWKQEDLAIKDRKKRVVDCLKTTLSNGPTMGRVSTLTRIERSVVQRIYHVDSNSFDAERLQRVLEAADTSCLDNIEMISLDVDREEIEEEDLITGFCHQDIDGNYRDGLKAVYREYFHLWKSVQRERARWVEKYPEFLFHVLIFDANLLGKRRSASVRQFMTLYRQIAIFYETDIAAISNGLPIMKDNNCCLVANHRLKLDRLESGKSIKPKTYFRYVFTGKGLLKTTKIGVSNADSTDT